MAIGGTKVVQVTNIAPQATKDQMQTLFGYLGKIDDIRLYPTIRDVSCPVTSRICYIKFVDTLTVGVAQHMTNTVFIDRALIVIPVQNGEIPDEYFALEMTRNGTIVPGLCPSEPNLPPHVINTVTNLGSGQVILTYDPKLEANGLPQYPPLPANYDSHKIEEIRRTILIKDVDPTNTNEDYIDFFSPVAEIKYLRSCTKLADDYHMLVEFSDQPSIIEVLKLNGKEFKGKPMQLVHATEAIVKPQAKSNEAAQKEIEEAMSRVKEAQNLISATIDPVIGMLSKDKRSSRRSRSRSRGRRRRSRSRSRSRRRSRSRHRSRRSRSKSRDRKRRSKSRSHRRSRSRSRRSSSHTRNSKARKSRSKSRSKTSRRHKSKERPKSPKEKEVKSKDVERSRDRDRKSKDVERDRESKEKRAEKESNVEVEEKRTSKKRSSISPSRTKFRSKSRDRKKSKSRERRSRSRGRKRTPSPRPRRRRSKSRSRDREHRREKQRDKREKRERSPSLPRTSRNYDEEERGYDSERSRRKDYMDSYETDNQIDKDSSEKSDNMDISNSP